MRIAHLGSKGIPSKGGTERVVEAIARRHAAAKHEVTVYGSRSVCSPGDLDGVRVLAFDAARDKHFGPVTLLLRCATHAVRRGRYDVIHLHGSENAFVLPILGIRYPVVTTNHGPAYLREKWSRPARTLIRSVERLSVRGASIATAVARNQAEALTIRHGRPVRHIPNGIEQNIIPEIEGARAMLRDLGLEPNSFLLFAAARVDPTKGCHTLLEAVASRPNLTPTLVLGDLGHASGYETRLRSMAAGLPVRFHPRIEDPLLLHGILRCARIFVFPSEVEAMSMMLLEALASGTPVVASDIPENLEILPPGLPTFRAGNAMDLACRLAEVDKQVEAGIWRGEETVSWVRSHHDWDRIAETYEGVYVDAVQGAGARRRHILAPGPGAC